MGGDGQWVTEVNEEEGRVGVKGGMINVIWFRLLKIKGASKLEFFESKVGREGYRTP